MLKLTKWISLHCLPSLLNYNIFHTYSLKRNNIKGEVDFRVLPFPILFSPSIAELIFHVHVFILLFIYLHNYYMLLHCFHIYSKQCIEFVVGSLQAGPNGSCHLLFTPCAVLFPWTLTRFKNQLLINRIWQKWWDITPKIRL